MHLPGALHGAEASLVSVSGSRKLRTAFCQASLSGSFRLANPGAVLSLPDGPAGSDPGFHVVWCRFRMLRRHMAYNSSIHELARVYSLLRVVSVGAPGHGPVHVLVARALSLGFSWDSDRCVCLLFVRSLVLFSFFGRLSGVLGELRLLVTLVLVLVFGVAGIWISEVL